MPNPKRFQLAKDRLDFLIAETLNASPAIARDDLKRLGVCVQKSRDKWTFAIFEIDQDFAFVVKSFLSLGALE